MTAPDAPLLSAADIRRLASELDLRPTKTLGQNFVIDPNTIRRITAVSGTGSGEHALEVGPGLGSLTLGLLDAAEAVTAVEIDPVPAGRLARTAEEFRPGAGHRLAVVLADAMHVSAAELEAARPAAASGPPTALVANLPYNVAVPVLLHLLAELPSLEHGLVMVQEEVADRLAAGPGSKTYGVPSAKAAWYASVRKAGTIGKNVFWPAPKIQSGLVAFTRRQPPETTASRQEVFAVVDAAFAQRRKTLRAALSGWAGTPTAAEATLRAAGVDPRARGEVLGIEDFARIAAHRVDAAETPTEGAGL
ncbi:16S rRNA (adenine(1518)-N(6)/adenine(1519)-N(6))-dimethyltransferase RsmA [Citricoccus nitrophenolicus]|uniref:Ribosomal RNA small subunit methyltransferase A n=1 Tax=Citricoccus muralis TaxID=169134 RepID=A0A3D9L8G0_9MICC|nr:16S rRNA (adenine(1518)-N(6)/adenine(1519)-N(6))-dimethyltransferase RsmA [Citricoccus muralis]REE02382.1 16S rRNA (adenine1518-N6/adenine1519-N6)-dimethyltransferase [Citricoccus muralis]